MALTHKQKKRYSLLILLVLLTIYIVVAVTLTSTLMPGDGATPILLELQIYILLGVAFFFPFKGVFMGVGQPDPNAPPEDDA